MNNSTRQGSKKHVTNSRRIGSITACSQWLCSPAMSSSTYKPTASTIQWSRKLCMTNLGVLTNRITQHRILSRLSRQGTLCLLRQRRAHLSSKNKSGRNSRFNNRQGRLHWASRVTQRHSSIRKWPSLKSLKITPLTSTRSCSSRNQSSTTGRVWVRVAKESSRTQGFARTRLSLPCFPRVHLCSTPTTHQTWLARTQTKTSKRPRKSHSRRFSLSAHFHKIKWIRHQQLNR